MSCEDIPKSCRGGLTALTETDFLPLYLYTKKMINNHEINKNKMEYRYVVFVYGVCESNKINKLLIYLLT